MFETHPPRKRSKSNLANKSWIGFDSLNGRLLAGNSDIHRNIGPGCAFQITNRVQLPFRGERLFINQKIASDFIIHNLKVGNLTCTASYGPITGDAFATRMDKLAEIDSIFKKDEVFSLSIEKGAYEINGMEWPLPVASPGTDITLEIENIGSEPKRFLAAMLGIIPEGRL